VPKLAPFFLPTVANEQGFTFKTSQEGKDSDATNVRKFQKLFTRNINLNKSKLFFKKALRAKFSTMNLFLSDYATKLSKTAKVEDCKSDSIKIEYLLYKFLYSSEQKRY
jgi:hypothetical protein